MIANAAQKSPLSSEPFLVRGVQEQTRGNLQVARNAFLAAQWRDPRSMPAAYFLADLYMRSGDAMEGLRQTTVLARLSPGGSYVVAPYIAAYAKNRSNWSQIRSLFRSQENIEDGVLTALADDARNADAILAVADAKHRNADSPWLRLLLNTLIASGEYGRARALWISIGRGSTTGGLIYDADFSAPQAPPPFNWQLSSSAVGFAERQPGKRLHVVFYGNNDGMLAGELVLLPSGTYHLQAPMIGTSAHPENLSWSIRCATSTTPLVRSGLVDIATHGWTFQIPGNCPAQWIELSGRSGDIDQQSEVTIAPLNLTRAGSNG